MLPHAAAVIGPRSVIKSMSMPYYDRAEMEFIHAKGPSRSEMRALVI